MATEQPTKITGNFYEKIVNIYFYQSPNQLKPSDQILSFTRGFKAHIGISGSIIANGLFVQIELRVMNAYITFDPNFYKYISFDAGYLNDINTGAISGQIQQAYIESPGPDGITVFYILLTDSQFFDMVIDFNYNAKLLQSKAQNHIIVSQPWTVGDILNELFNVINQATGQNYFPEIVDVLNVPYGTPIYERGTISQVLSQVLNNYFGYSFSIKGYKISIFNYNNPSSNTVYRVEKVSNTPRSLVGGHIQFQAPWIPNLRPGNLLYIDPSFMKMTFGAYITRRERDHTSDQLKTTIFNVLRIDFDFHTIEEKNMMIVDCLAGNNNLQGQIL